MASEPAPLIATVIAGARVVATALAVFPSTVAVMVAVPAVTAVTSPEALTVATLGAALLHVTARPVSAFPALSLALADSCAVCPTYKLPTTGVIVTVATGTSATVTVAVVLLPSTVAVIVAVPAATAVTSP